jgi:hypothetical protein
MLPLVACLCFAGCRLSLTRVTRLCLLDQELSNEAVALRKALVERDATIDTRQIEVDALAAVRLCVCCGCRTACLLEAREGKPVLCLRM